MIYREFLSELIECAGSFKWRLGYYHEIRATRAGRVDWSPLTAVAWHVTKEPLSRLTHAFIVERLKIHPEMAHRIYCASERVNPYFPEMTDDLLHAVQLDDFVGWGPPYDHGVICRPVPTLVP